MKIQNNDSVSTLVVRIVGNEIIVELEGEVLVRSSGPLGIRFSYGQMGESPTAGREPNTAWGMGDVDIAPIS